MMIKFSVWSWGGGSLREIVPKHRLALRSRLPCTDPKSGLRPEMGKKMAEKWILAPPGKGQKMAQKWENWPKNGRKNGSKMAIFPFLGHFFPLFPGRSKIHFSAIFFPFRAGGPIWGLYRAIGIASLAWEILWQYKLEHPQSLSSEVLLSFRRLQKIAWSSFYYCWHQNNSRSQRMAPGPVWSSHSVHIIFLFLLLLQGGSVDLGSGVSGPQAKKSPKSLEKVSQGPGPKSPKLSLEKGPTSQNKPWVFRDFSDLFWDLFRTFGDPGLGDFFETFWRLFGFWPRDSFSQVHGTSTPCCRRNYSLYYQFERKTYFSKWLQSPPFPELSRQ